MHRDPLVVIRPWCGGELGIPELAGCRTSTTTRLPAIADAGPRRHCGKRSSSPVLTSDLLPQTTILPLAPHSHGLRQVGSEGVPRIYPRLVTPAFERSWSAAGDVWYVGRLISENFLFDSLSALSLLIAFYYAFTA